MGEPQQAAPPQTLPADFQNWDAASSGAPPQSLPADFSQWDEGKNADQPSFATRTFRRLSENIVKPLEAIKYVGDAIFDPDSPARADFKAHLQKPLDPQAGLQRTLQASPAGQAVSLAKDWYHDQANLVGDALTAALLHASGSGAEETQTGESTAAAKTAKAAPKAPVDTTGVLGRIQDVVLRRAKSKIPGIQAAKDVAYILDGDAPAPPKPPTPGVPTNWGQGRYGTPVDQWGQRTATPAPAELDATEENVPYAGEKPPKAPRWDTHDATGENRRFAGGLDEPGVPRTAKPRTVVTDPKTGSPEFSDVVAAQQTEPPDSAPIAQAAPASEPLGSSSADPILDALRHKAARIRAKGGPSAFEAADDAEPEASTSGLDDSLLGHLLESLKPENLAKFRARKAAIQ